MDENNASIQEKVRIYHDLVKEYERLDSEIDALIMENKGASKNMSAEARARYQEMANRRRQLQNEMRILEQELLNDEE